MLSSSPGSIISDRINQYHVSSKRNVLRSTQHHIQPPNVKPESNHKKTSDKPKLKDILKIIKVMRDKERLKNHHRLQETKGSAIWILDWILKQKKNINGKMSEI